MIYLLLVSLAWGQENEQIVKYNQRTEIDFEAIDITGEMVKPQGSLIVERSNARFNPLIELRTDWNTEMNQSVNSIK
jgi:hypothetical protein